MSFAADSSQHFTLAEEKLTSILHPGSDLPTFESNSIFTFLHTLKFSHEQKACLL